MVVADGLNDIVPLAELDVKVPGVMATLVAPVVDQLSVLLAPEVMLVGLAEKEVMVGAEVWVWVCVEDPPQPMSTPIRRRSTMMAKKPI